MSAEDGVSLCLWSSFSLQSPYSAQMSPFTVQAFLFQVHTALGPFRDMKMIFTLSSYCSKQINKTNALFIFSMNRQEAKEHTGAHGFSLPSMASACRRGRMGKPGRESKASLRPSPPPPELTAARP